MDAARQVSSREVVKAQSIDIDVDKTKKSSAGEGRGLHLNSSSTRDLQTSHQAQSAGIKQQMNKSGLQVSTPTHNEQKYTP
jgi:hypothetical protein